MTLSILRRTVPSLWLLAAMLMAFPAPAAFAACDTSANAFALKDARDAIDAACPCEAAAKRGDHVKCAKPVIAARIEGGMLVKTCKSEALKHVTKSICGRPGAVVCCRVKTTGKTSHTIAKTPAKCVAKPTMSACTSAFPSVPTGCDANGCIVPVCGNGAVEPGETCDPPQADICDPGCQIVTCEPPVTSCGNGIVDGGEACEPPGVGACGWDCQATTCAASGPGEITVACSTQSAATVGVGARSGEYLLAWNDLTYRPDPDIVAHRVDADGAPLDATAKVVSAGVPCGGEESRPAVGSNAGRYVLAWSGHGPGVGGGTYFSAYTRPYDSTATLGPLDEHARKLPFGMCQESTGGPTSVARAPLAGPDTFAATWQYSGGCFGGPFFRDPDGVLLDYGMLPPTKTPIDIGYFPPILPLPAVVSDGTTSLATLGTDTLAAWHAHIANSSPPYASGYFVSGAWLAGDGTTSAFTISTRQAGIGPSSLLRPSVAAGSAALLVAWAEGPVDDATEIRGMRVTQPSGPLDPAGGLLLATTAGGEVVAGPVAAFDGTVWLVAWTEVGVGGNDLRAVAVATDGTVVDASPRLLASGLSGAEPAIASSGDGRSLVVYVRPDGGKSAVSAQLVPGT